LQFRSNPLSTAALSEPFSIGHEQGEVHRNGELYLSINLAFTKHRFREGGGGRVRRRLSLQLSAVAPLLLTTPWRSWPRAGGLLGLLIYKPQLGLLIPVALLAGRH
jgi:hypothetical protein